MKNQQPKPGKLLRFNRYMVECESSKTASGDFYTEVLIDTWWNVNINNYDSHKKSTSFNRYMVECEYPSKPRCKNRFNRFNRYMVECECITTIVDNLSLLSFNRYMVECE